ncbi:unnamed protein product [Wuchereria bancrofti]|uniref:XRN2-binding (XTBD) domain-containing protein n=1 Tax=Wuchereria bancrofti TaxID=6293 RepID=A0A3P7EGZ2_WUCBA|nr:unnamed protein product [Wuchereria bancrofti]
MDELLDMNSLDSLRTIHESDEQWKLRRMFLERHMADYPKNRLLCLAQIYCNMISLGCTYNPELMKAVREMGAGLCEMSKGCKRTFEQNSIKAPVSKKERLESKSVSTISEDSPCALKRKEDREVRAKGGKFELCKGDDSGPSDFYTSYLMDQLKLAVKVMPNNGTSFDKLESGLRVVRMPLRYVAERGTGWEQKISINALNVQLANAVLRKGECNKSREKERKEDLATLVIQKLSNSDFELIPSNNGYILR